MEARCRLCWRRNWNTSRLLLALPQRNDQAKPDVQLLAYKGALRMVTVQQWVAQKVGARLPRLESAKELRRWADGCAVDLCMLLVSSLTLPPFFLSALNVKFTGRVRFASADPFAFERVSEQPVPLRSLQSSCAQTLDDDDDDGDGGNSRRLDGRYFLISSATSRQSYGPTHRLSERLTFEHLSSFLRGLAPDLNDVFVWSFALTNILAVMTIFEMRGSPLQIISLFCWTLLKFNVIFIVCWFFLLGVVHRPVFARLCNLSLSTARRVLLSARGRSLLGDAHALATDCNRAAVAALFVGLNVLVNVLRRRFWPQSLREADWFRLPRPSVVFNPGRPTFVRDAEPHLDPRVRAVVRQLGVAPHRVASRLPFDFLFNLPLRPFTERASRWPRRVCFRCRCVRALRLRRLAQRLGREPCSRCGFDGATDLPAASHACPICLEAYRFDDELCQLPCDHAYHRNCVFAWLLTDPQQTCPCCRWPAYAQKNKASL